MKLLRRTQSYFLIFPSFNSFYSVLKSFVKSAIFWTIRITHLRYIKTRFFGVLVKSARFQKLFSEKNLAEKKSKKKTKENNAIRV